MQIKISWLFQKPSDLDLHYLLRQGMSCSAREGLIKIKFKVDLDSHPASRFTYENQGPVVQSVVSLTSSLRVISLTVLADSIYNILIFFAEKM